jgi:hypothetical protein
MHWNAALDAAFRCSAHRHFNNILFILHRSQLPRRLRLPTYLHPLVVKECHDCSIHKIGIIKIRKMAGLRYDAMIAAWHMLTKEIRTFVEVVTIMLTYQNEHRYVNS